MLRGFNMSVPDLRCALQLWMAQLWMALSRCQNTVTTADLCTVVLVAVTLVYHCVMIRRYGIMMPTNVMW